MQSFKLTELINNCKSGITKRRNKQDEETVISKSKEKKEEDKEEEKEKEEKKEKIDNFAYGGIDVIVSSTDKNFLTPVGGSIIYTTKNKV